MAISAFGTTPPTQGVPELAGADMSLIEEQFITPEQEAFNANMEVQRQQLLTQIEERNKPTKLESKQQQVDQKLAEKSDQAIGQPKSDGLLNLLGSSAFTTGADLADTAVELGSAIAGGVSDVTGLDFHTKDDREVATTFLDPYTEQSYGDELTGYDRSDYAASMKQAEKQVSEGEYFDAFITGAKKAPELVMESLPYMATLGVGGRLKVVTQAGKAAAAKSAQLGGTKAMQAAAKADAIKRTEQGLSLAKSVTNLGAKNAGLLAMSTTQTKNQNEEFTKNNDGEGMTALQMTRATAINVVMNGLDRGIFNSVTGLVKNKKALKQVWGEIPQASKATIAKKIATVPVDMTKEAAQEYLQTWGEMVNEQWGTKDNENLATVLAHDKNNIKGITAALMGASSGGLMSTPKTVASTLNEANKGRKERKELAAAASYTDSGFATQEDQTKAQEVATAQGEDTKATFETLGKAEETIAKINKSNRPDLEKVSLVQRTMHGDGDKATDKVVASVGSKEVNDVLAEIAKDEELVNNEEFIARAQELQGVKSPLGRLQLLNDILKDTKHSDMLKEKLATVSDQATQLVKDGSTEITYQNAQAQLNKEGKVTKSVSDALSSRKAPKPKSDVKYSELEGLSSKELKAKLATYDAKALTEIAKTASSRVKQEVRGIKSTLFPSTDSKVVKTARNIKATRKAAKAQYDPTKPIDAQVKDTIAKAVENVKNADVKTIVEAVKNLKNIDQKDIPGLEKTIDNLMVAGMITETAAKKLKTKITDYAVDVKNKAAEAAKTTTEEATKSTKEVYKDVRTYIKDKVSKILKSGEDVNKQLDKFVEKGTGKFSDIELEFIANARTKIDEFVKENEEYAAEEEKVREEREVRAKEGYAEDLAYDTEDIAALVKMQNKIVDRLKKDENNVLLNQQLKTTQDNIAKARAEVAPDLIKDTKELFDTMVESVKDKSAKEWYDQVVAYNENLDYEGAYLTMKQFMTDKANKVKTKIVESQVLKDKDGKTIFNLGDC